MKRGEKHLIGLDCGRARVGWSVDDRFAQARKVLKANFGKFCLSSSRAKPYAKLLPRCITRKGVWNLEYAYPLIAEVTLRRKEGRYILDIEALIA